MPNLGPLEIFMFVFIIGVPIGIGYWCMRIFRRKLRSAGAGFALGFLLTLFLSLIGAAIAVAISYAEPSRTLIATFGPATVSPGRKITYDSRGFVHEQIGRISAQDVLSYDTQGSLLWAHDGMRDWVIGLPGPGVAGAS